MNKENEKLREKVVSYLEKIGIDVTYKRFSTDNIMIRCPFAKIGGKEGGHSKKFDRNPSLGLRITVEGFTYNCFTCGRSGGTIIKFFEELKKYNLIESSSDAYELQNMMFADLPEYDEQYVLKEKNISIDYNLRKYSEITSEALRYNITRRKIHADTVRDVELHFKKKTKQILFPCYTKKRDYVGYVEHYINGRLPKYNNKLDTGKVLYLEWLIKGKIGIISEGMYDAVRTYQHLKDLDLLDKYSSVGTFGAEVTFNHTKLMVKYFDTLILYGDNDSAGTKMEERIFRMCGKKIPLIYRINYVGKDPGVVSLKQFEKVLSNIVLFGIDEMPDKTYFG